MSPTELISMKSRAAASPVEAFIACAHQMLDPATPETARRAMEPRLLAQLPALQALGVFELFEVRHRALRSWLADELAVLSGRDEILLEQTQTDIYLP